jgi:hypothetical protein
MFARHCSAKLICSAVLLTGVWSSLAALGAEKETAQQGGKVAGIMFDFDLKANWITPR